LSGHVKHQGVPVSNVLVSVFASSQSSSVSKLSDALIQQQRTGANGEFSFDIQAGFYRLLVEPDSTTRFLRFTTAILISSNDASCNVTLSTGMILRGSVRTANGTVIRSGEVAALGIEPSSYRAVGVVDEDGTYALTLPRGKFHIAYRGHRTRISDVDLPGVTQQQISSQVFISNEIKVVDVHGDDQYDLFLPDFVEFTGEIVTGSGQPVLNARVTITSEETKDRTLANELGLGGVCSSDAHGKFVIHAQPGVYSVNIEPDKAGEVSGVRDNRVHINEISTSKKFKLPEGFRLRGKVVFEGEVLSHCLVRVQGLDKKMEVIARTDEHGKFSVNLPSGNYKLIVSAHPKDSPTVTIAGAAFSLLAPWSSLVAVTADTEVDVALQRGTALHGTIVDASGQPKPGIRVSLFADLGTHIIVDEQIDRALSSGVTGSDGKYSIYIAPGTYWVALHTDLANATKVEIGAEPKEFDITWHGLCQVRFQVISLDDGRTIPRCRVAYTVYGPGPLDFEASIESQTVDSTRGQVVTGDDGTCEFTLPAGVYAIRFTPPPDSSYDPRLLKQVSINSSITRTIKLQHKYLS
jgi:hypothetical protein